MWFCKSEALTKNTDTRKNWGFELKERRKGTEDPERTKGEEPAEEELEELDQDLDQEDFCWNLETDHFFFLTV